MREIFRPVYVNKNKTSPTDKPVYLNGREQLFISPNKLDDTIFIFDEQRFVTDNNGVNLGRLRNVDINTALNNKTYFYDDISDEYWAVL